MKMNIAENPPGAVPLKSPRKSTRRLLPRYEEIPAFLPPHLRERLKTYKVPATEAILRREARALKNAKVMNEEKVMRASVSSARVEKAKAVRAEYRLNFTLIGGHESNTVQLPLALKKRLAMLKDKSAHRTTPESILAKEKRVSDRKSASVTAKQLQFEKHHARVYKLQKLKATKPRYENAARSLPERLQKRLKAYCQPVPAAILRKEKRVAARKAAVVEGVKHRAKQHNDNVKIVVETKERYRENFELMGGLESKERSKKQRLPTRLANRLALLNEKFGNKTAKKILDKEDAAVQRKLKIVRAKVHVRQGHAQLVQNRKLAKRLVQRYEGDYTHLPAHLRAVISQYKRHSNKALLDREARAHVHRQHFLRQRSAKARAATKLEAAKARKQSFLENGIFFETSCEVTPVKLPVNLKRRLAQLDKPLDAGAIVAKNEGALCRAQALKGARVQVLQKHSQSVKERMDAKRREQRFDDLADYLPERLKQRLRKYTRPTARAILLANALVNKRKNLKLEATVQRLMWHHAKVEDVKKSRQELLLLLCPSKEKVNLPTELQKRLDTFTRPTAEKIFKKEALAEARKAELLARLKNKAQKRNKIVQARRTQKVKVPRFSEIPEFLPVKLRQRLENTRKDSPERITARFNRAVKRGALLQASKVSDVKSHLAHVADVHERKQDFRKNFVLMGACEATKLPARLTLRLKELQEKFHNHSAEDILRNFEEHIEKREEKLNAKKAACSAHQGVVEQRKQAKRLKQSS